MTDTVWPIKPQIFATWPFTEKVWPHLDDPQLVAMGKDHRSENYLAGILNRSWWPIGCGLHSWVEESATVCGWDCGIGMVCLCVPLCVYVFVCVCGRLIFMRIVRIHNALLLKNWLWWCVTIFVYPNIFNISSWLQKVWVVFSIFIKEGAHREEGFDSLYMCSVWVGDLSSILPILSQKSC